MLVLEQSPPLFTILVFVFVLVLIDHVHAQGDPIADSNQFPCFNSENYTSNSPFQTNLNILLSSLVSNGSQDGFFNTSVGVSPDIAYGLVQCRGDIPPDFCQSCLHNSTVELINRCPNRKVATLRYDHCILRYSNTRFFSQIDNIVKSEYNPVQVSEADASRFNEQLRSLLTNVSQAAASRPNGFGYGNASYNSSGARVYGLVQCNEDLSRINCNSCVRNLISEISDCCDKRIGAKIFSAACYLRYEQTDFALRYEQKDFAISPAPTEPQGTDRNNASFASCYSFNFSIYLVIALTVTGLLM